MRPIRGLLSLRLGPRVPAAVLRGLLAVVCALVVTSVVHGPLLVAGLAVAVAAAVLPPIAWAVALLAVLADLVQPAGVGLAVFVLVAGIHAVAVLVALTGAVPWRAQVELAALARPARRYVLIELPAQALAVAVAVSLHRLPVVPAAALAGGLVVAAAAVLVVRGLPRLRELSRGSAARSGADGTP